MRCIFKSFFVLALLSSCSSRNTEQRTDVPEIAYLPMKPKGVMEQIEKADSAAVIYYNQPANPRFFRVVKLRNLSLLQGTMAEINGEFLYGFEECPSMGKFYFYGKGDIVDVVYFSIIDSCMTFSFIKNGDKHFTRMGLSSKKLIDSLSIHAIAPKASN